MVSYDLRKIKIKLIFKTKVAFSGLDKAYNSHLIINITKKKDSLSFCSII